MAGVVPTTCSAHPERTLEPRTFSRATPHDEHFWNSLGNYDEEIISIFGQLKSPEAVETLMSFLMDENAEIRSDAAMALGSIGDKKATDFLLERLQKEEDEWTKMQLIGALQKTNDPSAIPAIIEALRDDKEKVRLCAARALRNMTPHNFANDYNKWKEWWEKEQKK